MDGAIFYRANGSGILNSIVFDVRGVHEGQPGRVNLESSDWNGVRRAKLRLSLKADQTTDVCSSPSEDLTFSIKSFEARKPRPPYILSYIKETSNRCSDCKY